MYWIHQLHIRYLNIKYKLFTKIKFLNKNNEI